MKAPLLLFGAETVSWPRAPKKSGKRYRGVVEAADYFMARWHSGETERSWLRHAAEDAETPRAATREDGGGGGGAAVLIQLSTNPKTKL